MISVVIASRNGARLIGEALDSLAAQDFAGEWEVVLADNGSTDRTRDIFLDWAVAHPHLRTQVVPVFDRAGKSHALNVAIAAAAGDRLAFLDDDDTVEPGWLTALDAALDAAPFVAARTDVRRLNPAHAAEARQHPQQDRLMRLRHRPFCAYAGGATLGMRREVFDRAGGFDPEVPSLEDIDFCVRAHLAGYELVFAPAAVYNYRFRTDPDAIRRQQRNYARARAQLRRRYAGAEGRLKPTAWMGLAAEFGRLGLVFAGIALLGAQSELATSRFFFDLGRAEGNLAGALAFGVAPPTGFNGLKTRARSAWRTVRGLWTRSTVSVRTGERAMALTFDDGPDPASTPALLDTLARLNVRATFFLIGERAERHPEIVARIRAEGHEIGNHGWSHASLPTLAADEVREELVRTAHTLAPAGQALMRPPYGDQSAETNRVACRLGYRVVLWSVSGDDWLGHDGETIAGRILERAAPGAIVLLHDSLATYEDPGFRDRAPTIEAVARVVESLPEYRFVTVSELLASGAPVVRGRVKRTDPAQLARLLVAPGEEGHPA